MPLALPYPQPGPALRNAYLDLDLVLDGTDADRAELGDPSMLPRPWDPSTMTTPRLRAELWEWLEAVTTWINTEYAWDSSAGIPACWPMHPHLVHEIAVIADQRYKAALAYSSDLLEDWHRYALPAFLDRLNGRVRTMCDERHQEWPGRSRYARFAADAARRKEAYRLDEETSAPPPPDEQPRLRVVEQPRIDPLTGEVTYQ